VQVTKKTTCANFFVACHGGGARHKGEKTWLGQNREMIRKKCGGGSPFDVLKGFEEKQGGGDTTFQGIFETSKSRKTTGKGGAPDLERNKDKKREDNREEESKEGTEAGTLGESDGKYTRTKPTGSVEEDEENPRRPKGRKEILPLGTIRRSVTEKSENEGYDTKKRPTGSRRLMSEEQRDKNVIRYRKF